MFKQVDAIPMRSNPTPFFKSFSLFLCRKMGKENNKRLKTQRQKDWQIPIDDLAILNDDGEFERSPMEIYPPELELKN